VKKQRSMAGTLVFIVFAAFGLVMLGVGVREWLMQRSTLAAAQPVPATITKSEVFTSRSADTDRSVQRNTSTSTYRPEVSFEYEVGGVRYTSDLLRPSIIVTGYASREAAAELLTPYPLGARVTAHVDPAHPERAFLDVTPTSAPMVFIIVGLLLIPVAWFGSRLV
jgi:hypothetical protein